MNVVKVVNVARAVVVLTAATGFACAPTPAVDAGVIDAGPTLDNDVVPCAGTVSGVASATLVLCHVNVITTTNGAEVSTGFGFDLEDADSDAVASFGLLYFFDGGPVPGTYTLGDAIGGGIATLADGTVLALDHDELEPTPDDLGSFSFTIATVTEREQDGLQTLYDATGAVQATWVLQDETLMVDATF